MKKLIYYGGEGFTYAKEIGNYEVISDAGNSEFQSLKKAIEYFESLNCEKSIWDRVRGDLLECYCFEPQKRTDFSDIFNYVTRGGEFVSCFYKKTSKGYIKVSVHDQLEYPFDVKEYTGKTFDSVFAKIKKDINDDGQWSERFKKKQYSPFKS